MGPMAECASGTLPSREGQMAVRFSQQAFLGGNTMLGHAHPHS